MKFLILLIPLFGLAQEESTIDTLKINCDSIFSSKGFSILHITYDKELLDGYSGEKNSVFIYHKTVNGKVKEVYRDTIYSRVQQIDFLDFNNDKVKDILIQNMSDARSNWSYNLYFVNPKDYSLTKVKGFGEIMNPNYNAKYNIVESRVSSGKDYTAFYKIVKNHIYDYKIYIEDKHEDDDVYDKEYTRAIKKILKKNKIISKK